MKNPNSHFVYLTTKTHPDTVIELSKISGAKGAFFRHIADAAAGWDGSEPIRGRGR